MSIPLVKIPVGDWFCAECLVANDADFGFEDGPEYGLKEFQIKSDGLKRNWFTNKREKEAKAQGTPFASSPILIQTINGDGGGAYGFCGSRLEDESNSEDPSKNVEDLSISDARLSVTENEVEKEFWRLVESPYNSIEVEYGADLHSSTHGR